MKVIDLYRRKRPVISFEFFLPKTPEDMDKFRQMLLRVRALSPDFVTLTYGAGGSARERTIDAAGMLKNEFGFETVMHLTCIAHTRAEIVGIVARVRALGIENIMALRGDVPKDGSAPPLERRDYKYGSDLIRHLRTLGDFCLGAAGYPEGHPEAPSKEKDLQVLKEKIDAGADYVATQLFFDNRDYFDFVARARAAGVAVPIVPGIMPITNFSQIRRFATMCGAHLPRRMLDRLEPVQADPDAVAALGIEFAVEQCRELLARGAPGLHFYTLNRSRSTEAILSRLRQEGLR